MFYCIKWIPKFCVVTVPVPYPKRFKNGDGGISNNSFPFFTGVQKFSAIIKTMNYL